MVVATQEYPKVVRCRNHLTVIIKPLDHAGIDSLLTMLRELAPEQQTLLPCDVNDPTYIDTLREQVDTGSVIRLAAWHGTQRIVGSLAMYPGTSRWIRHTARLITVVHPEFRRMGVAHALLDEVLTLAEEHGIRKIYCELTDLHKEACQLVKAIGFSREATLDEHMLDDQGELHKLGIFSMKVEEASLRLTERMFQYVRMDYKA